MGGCAPHKDAVICTPTPFSLSLSHTHQTNTHKPDTDSPTHRFARRFMSMARTEGSLCLYLAGDMGKGVRKEGGRELRNQARKEQKEEEKKNTKVTGMLSFA